jgi:hypothetical protein
LIIIDLAGKSPVCILTYANSLFPVRDAAAYYIGGGITLNFNFVGRLSSVIFNNQPDRLVGESGRRSFLKLLFLNPSPGYTISGCFNGRSNNTKTNRRMRMSENRNVKSNIRRFKYPLTDTLSVG